MIEFTSDEIKFCRQQSKDRLAGKWNKSRKSGWNPETIHLFGILGEFILDKYLGAAVDYNIYGANGDGNNPDAVIKRLDEQGNKVEIPIFCKTAVKVDNLWCSRVIVQNCTDNAISVLIKIPETLGEYLNNCVDNETEIKPEFVQGIEFVGWIYTKNIEQIGKLNHNQYYKTKNYKDVCYVTQASDLRPITELIPK